MEIEDAVFSDAIDPDDAVLDFHLKRTAVPCYSPFLRLVNSTAQPSALNGNRGRRHLGLWHRRRRRPRFPFKADGCAVLFTSRKNGGFEVNGVSIKNIALLPRCC